MSKRQLKHKALFTIGLLGLFFLQYNIGLAITIPQSETSNGSIGLVGTIPSPPPSTAATIATPVNGASFTALPVTINGLCPSQLLVKLFSNNVFIGSIDCNNGSYSLPVDLFAGQNILVARDYDALDQAGPDSNTVNVSYDSSIQVNAGSQLSISSNYAKRGSNPGNTLSWPFIISGGTGPYAISIDWGDNSSADLISQNFSGIFTADHIYHAAGVYNVTIRVTDTNKNQAFFEVVAVANGAVVNLNNNSNNQASSLISNNKPQIIWWPAVAMLPLIIASFWVGGKHQLFSLRKQLDKQRGQADNK